MSIPSSRGSVLGGLVVGVAMVSIGAVAVYSFSSEAAPTAVSSTTSTSSTAAAAPAAPAGRQLQPQELATLLTLLDLSPESLAAAGISSLECDGIFDATFTYCIQADRLNQLSLAYRTLNAAKAQAATPPSLLKPHDGPPLPTIADAQAAVDQIKSDTFRFVTTGLNPHKVQFLSKIHANAHWGLPAHYLVLDRTPREWSKLRGALAMKRRADETGETLRPQAAQLIADADNDPGVIQAKAAAISGLQGLRQAWDARARNRPADGQIP